MLPSDLLNFDPLHLAEIVLRSVVVYFFLLAGLRLSGKRELGQLTTFDLVLILLISNAVQSAMVGSDTSLTGGLVAAFALLGVNRLMGLLIKASPWLEERLTGTPTILIHDGALLLPRLQQEGVTEEEVMQALREHGIDDLKSVKLAVLEVDGTISVIPQDASITRTRRRMRGRKPIG